VGLFWLICGRALLIYKVSFDVCVVPERRLSARATDANSSPEGPTVPTTCDSARCSVLQCVAVRCSVLHVQCVACVVVQCGVLCVAMSRVLFKPTVRARALTVCVEITILFKQNL